MTVVPFNVERQNSAGEGRSSRGQPRPYRKGAGPQRSPLFGSSSIYVYTLWRRTTKFDVEVACF